jgi:hypothetical protein
MTTDQALYEALGSIEDRDTINFNKLIKLLEVTTIASFKTAMKKSRNILTHERADDIRKTTKTQNNRQE